MPMYKRKPLTLEGFRFGADYYPDWSTMGGGMYTHTCKTSGHPTPEDLLADDWEVENE